MEFALEWFSASVLNGAAIKVDADCVCINVDNQHNDLCELMIR